MSQICYPYGDGITCVCDQIGLIQKCFPKPEAPGQKHSLVHAGQGEDSVFKPNLKAQSFLDGSTEIVLASTFLLIVILVFLGFVLYRCEKTLLRRKNQGHKNCQSHSSLSYISVSVQTDLMSSAELNHSSTIPQISNGSAKTGMTSLYTLSRNRNGSITAGYLLPPPPPLKHPEHEQLLKQDITDLEKQQNHTMVLCNSPEEIEDLTESDTGVQSEVGLCEKY